MIQFVYDKDREIGDFVASRVPAEMNDFGRNFKTIGVLKNGDFVAGAVYHHWNPDAETIAMSLAATNPRWMTRSVLFRILDFPFNECGCQMLLAQTPATNLRVQRQLAAAGFAFNRIRRVYGRNEDAVIATLTDEDWRECPFNRSPIEWPRTKEAA